MKTKNKLIAGIGLILTLSVGIVVNSQKLGGGSKNENYSEALNKDFTGEVSTYNKEKFNILPPGKQFWDGLTPEEKAGKVLVVPKHTKDENGNIDHQNYEKLVIEKKDKHGKGINGIQFCIAKDPEDITKGCDKTSDYSNWITDEDGKLEIPTNELPLYNQALIETGGIAKNYKPQKIDLYIDPGNRFLGEVKGDDFIKYNELIATIVGDSNPKKKRYDVGNDTKIGHVLSKGNDIETGGNWLKIYDARASKIMYISKTPLTRSVSWQELYKAGVVYGLDQIDKETMKLKIQPQIPEYKSKIEPGWATGTIEKIGNLPNYKGTTVEINGKTYIVRLLKASNKLDPNVISDTNYYTTNSFDGSEWNRYILPLVKDNRFGNQSRNRLEDALKEEEGTNYKIQLAKYNWFRDIIMSDGESTWTQEYTTSNSARCYRGDFSDSYGAAFVSGTNPCESYRNYGFRPVLEEISNN